MALTTEQKTLIELQVNNVKKSEMVAWFLWFFLGWIFSAHRFYLNRPWTAILQVLIYFIVIILFFLTAAFPLLWIITIWWLIDAALIRKYLHQHNHRIREELMREAEQANQS